jgi:exopolysaccharide production protein ExoF
MKCDYVRALRGLSLIKLLVTAALWSLPAVAYAAEYKLGPDDKVRVMVFEWRPSRGEPYEWAPLNAEFTVNSDGMLSLPLVGDIAVANLTAQQVGAQISDLMQQRMGLVSRPTASVEITRYRPFYITGYIANPGEFPFRPGLTVAKSFAIAGGIYRATGGSAAAYLKDATVARGDLRVMTSERDGLLAKKSRLEAEASDETKIDFPADLTRKDAAPKSVDNLRQERMIFEYRKSAVKSKIDSLNQEKNMLAQEIAALNLKDASMGKQLELVNAERQNVRSLADKGLAITTRQIAVEQSLAQIESGRLDLQVARFKAEQDRTKTDRDIAALQDQRRSDLLLELRQVETRIAELTERIATTQRLAVQAESMSSQDNSDAERVTEMSPSFVITRLTEKGSIDIPADRSTAVEPGDVVNVLRPDTRMNSGGAAPPSGRVSVR